MKQQSQQQQPIHESEGAPRAVLRGARVAWGLPQPRGVARQSAGVKQPQQPPAHRPHGRKGWFSSE